MCVFVYAFDSYSFWHLSDASIVNTINKSRLELCLPLTSSRFSWKLPKVWVNWIPVFVHNPCLLILRALPTYLMMEIIGILKVHTEGIFDLLVIAILLKRHLRHCHRRNFLPVSSVQIWGETLLNKRAKINYFYKCFPEDGVKGISSLRLQWGNASFNLRWNSSGKRREKT